MKPHLLLLALLIPLFSFAQRTGVLFPKEYDSKFQDVYVDGDGVGYAVGSCGVIVYTQNDGMTWDLVNEVSQGYDYLSVVCLEDDCTKAVIGGNGILLKLTAGSFQEIGSGNDYRSLHRLHDLGNGIIIGDRQDEDYIRSTDSGASWTLITFPVRQSSFMEFAPDGTGFYLDNEESLMKTTDGAASFSPTGYQQERGVRTMYYKNAQTGWIFSGANTVMMTTDGGATFTDMNAMNGPTGLLYATSLSDNTLVGIQNVNTLFRSTDNGATWTSEPMTTASGTRPNFYNYHQRGDEFFIPSDGAEVYYSAAGFSDFTPLITGTDRSRIEFIKFYDNSFILVGGATRLLLKTEDAGESWTPLVVSTGNDRVLDAYILSPQEFIIFFTNSDPLYTNDGGDTFTEWLPEGIADQLSSAGDFIKLPGGRLMVIGHQNLAYSDDNGVNWTVVDHGISTITESSFFVNDLVGYIGARSYRIAKTTDGGDTWTEMTPASPSGSQGIASLYFTDENTGWASTGSRIYRTSDGGQNWTFDFNEDGGAHDYQLNSGDGAIYGAAYEGGNNSSVQVSEDNGVTWESRYLGCAAGRAGALSPDGSLYMVGGDGGHLRLIDLTITSTPELKSQIESLSIFPNPGHGLLTINLDQASQSTYVQVFSIDGLELFSKKIDAALSQVQIDLTQLSSGIYLIKSTDASGKIRQGKLLVR